MPDVFEGLAKFVLGRMEQSLIGQWLRLLFEIIFSGLVSYYLVSGSLLMGGSSWLFAVGSGRVTAAICMTVVFRRASEKLTHGLFVILPQLEANKELESDLETIRKSEKDK